MKKQLQIFGFAVLFNFLSIAMFGTAQFQVIHNAADPELAVVDIYVNGFKILNDVAFRTATPFVPIILSAVENIGIAPGSSTSVNDTFKNFPLVLVDGQRYVVIANGVLNPDSFSSNPDSKATALNLFVKNNIQNAGASSSVVNILALHGASDAPAVDVLARGVGTLFNDLSYGDFSSYDTVPNTNYILDVTLAAGTPVVASFQANLSALGGKSAIVFASGFLNPAANKNGPAFGLFAALANGTVVSFDNVTGIDESEKKNAVSYEIYPNPAVDEITINTTNNTPKAVVEISNSVGQVVKTVEMNDSKLIITTSNFFKGMYVVSIQNSFGRTISKLIIN